MSGAKLLTPLVVLVPILAAPLGAIWITHESQVSAWLLLIGGLAAVPGTPRFCETWA